MDIGSVQTAAELLLGIRDLNLELGVALRQTLSDDVIDKAVTVFQVVAWQLASEADGRSVLALRDCPNHQINLFIVEGGFGHG